MAAQPEPSGRGRPHNDGADASPDTLQALARGLSLLTAMAVEDQGFLLTDLARRTGLAPSTTHGLPSTLERHRFAGFEQDEGLWRVGAQAVTVGASFIRGRDFVASPRH